MSDLQEPPTDSPSNGSEPMEVARDGTFHRAVADMVMVMELGNELELACIQLGRRVTSITMRGEGQSLATRAEATEVVRLRIDYPAGVTLAMNILQRGIRNDVFRGEEILNSIQEWIAAAADDAESTGE